MNFSPSTSKPMRLIVNKTAHKQAYRQNGFTLIELIITVAIIAILAGVAYPSYTDYVYRARHSDAYDCLVDASQRQEEFFYNNNTYTTNLAGLGLAAGVVSCGDGGSYTLTAAAGATGIGSSYLLTATRTGAQTGDTKCGDLTLSNIGVKGNLNASRPADECW